MQAAANRSGSTGNERFQNGATWEWARHIIDYGGRAGGGMQIPVVDIDGVEPELPPGDAQEEARVDPFGFALRPEFRAEGITPDRGQVGDRDT